MTETTTAYKRTTECTKDKPVENRIDTDLRRKQHKRLENETKRQLGRDNTIFFLTKQHNEQSYQQI